MRMMVVIVAASALVLLVLLELSRDIQHIIIVNHHEIHIVTHNTVRCTEPILCAFACVKVNDAWGYIHLALLSVLFEFASSFCCSKSPRPMNVE